MYQEPTVFPDLSVAENVFAGRHPRSGLRTVDWGAMQRRGDAHPRTSSASTSARTRPVRGLGVADRQLLEIAKALSSSARLLIMDEPTAALSPHEVENLFAHRARSCASAASRSSTSAIGSRRSARSPTRSPSSATAGTSRRARRPSCSQGEIIRLMVGRSLDALFPKEEAEIGDVVLKAEGLTRRGVFADISFELRRGEIVGLAGFVGAGRTEVARSIFGVDPLDGGHARDRGPAVQAALAARGAAPRPRLPARGPAAPGPRPADVDRRQHLDGRPAGADARRVPAGRGANERSRGGSWSSCASRPRRRRRSCGASQAATSRRSCSAKWLAAEPRILILDEPTHGVDVGTKADVHRTISHLAAQGLTILLISSELPEILGMSDRVLVMREGRLVAELSRAEATQERVIQAAAGVEAAA